MSASAKAGGGCLRRGGERRQIDEAYNMRRARIVNKRRHRAGKKIGKINNIVARNKKKARSQQQ